MDTLHEKRRASHKNLINLLKKWREGDDYRAHEKYGHPAIRPHDAQELAMAFDAYEEILPEKIEV
jgi:hypothetical protein